MRAALAPLSRWIATPEVSKHRLFQWVDPSMLPSGSVYAIARDDDTTFGILHSMPHRIWAARLGTRIGVGNDLRYTSTTTFETFPFPEALAPTRPASDYAGDPRAQAIAAAARDLVARRDQWLNPESWVEWEVLKDYPAQAVARPGHEAHLAERTLTKLYNAPPDWLRALHDDLDHTVAAAYGWGWPLEEGEILRHLFELNQQRAIDHPLK